MSEFAYPLGGKQDYTSAQAGAFHGRGRLACGPARIT